MTKDEVNKMKKYIMLLTLFATLLAGACGMSEPIPAEATPAGQDLKQGKIVIEPPLSSEEDRQREEGGNEDGIKIEKSEIIVAFETLLDKPSTGAGDIARYMEEHVSQATIGEMDYMLAYLMIYQTEAIEKGKTLLSKEASTFYSGLIEGYMRVVYREEKAVIEMDWHRLASLGPVFSEGLNYVIATRAGLEDPYDQDYYRRAEKIVEAESLLKNEETLFAKNQLLDLIATWSSYLVAGPDTSFYDYYMIKDQELYDQMLDFSKEYSGTPFSDFMKELVEADINDYTDISKAYDRYIHGIGVKGYSWIYRTDIGDLSSVRRIGYKSDSNKIAKQKINSRIQSRVDAEIDRLKDFSPYSIECVLTYDDGQWATVKILSAYQQSDTEKKDESLSLSFDVNTGEAVNLGSLFKLSETKALDEVNQLVGTAFDSILDLELTESALVIQGKIKDSNDTGRATVTYKEMVPYNKPYNFDQVAGHRYDKRPQDILISRLEKDLRSDMSTEDYVIYLENHIHEATQTEAEKMIEVLMIFQSETIVAGNRLLNTPTFKEAFLSGRDQEDIKAFLKNIEASYLKVDRDQDHLFLRMDWSKIATLEGKFSEAFDYVIKMRSQMSYKVTRDYEALAKAIIRLEVMEDKVKSPFVKAQMEALYDTWTRQLLIGEEGENYSAFIGQSNVFYKDMMGLAKTYSNSDLGRFLLTLDQLEGKDDEKISHRMTAFFLSENLGYKKWQAEFLVNEPYKVHTLVYQEIGQSEKTDKMNQKIAELTRQLENYASHNSRLEGANYTITIYPTYYDNRYVTLSMGLEYQVATEENKLYNQLVTLDMKTGDKLSLDKYLNIYSEQGIAIVNNMLKTGYTVLPSIYMTQTGIGLTSNEVDPYQHEDQHLSKRRLIPYLGLDPS